MKQKTSEEVLKSCCNMCYRLCGVLVYLNNGKVTKIEGDPDCPVNRGNLCIKGPFAVERLYHPARLKYPIKRTGARGEGKWQRISWDEALGTIAEAMNNAKQRYGAESVVFSSGDPKGFEGYIVRLSNVFGTPNLCAPGHVCSLPRRMGSNITTGLNVETGTDYTPDLDFPPSCILMWGANIAFTHNPNYVRLEKALARKGTKLIVVDPRKTELASRADLWIQPRPKTDLALALGMMNVIVNEELYDKSFVSTWTVGFDKLQVHVQSYPPRKVAEIAWVPAEQIEAAARLYATTKPACIQDGNAIDDDINSVQTARATSILRAITGNLSVPGGEVDYGPLTLGLKQHFTPGKQETTSFMLTEKLSKEQRNKRIGTDHGFLPLTIAEFVLPQLLVNAILTEQPYPVKVLCVHANNPLITWSNVQEVYQALMRVDFLYVADQFMTPTAELADIVLPAATYLEVDDIMTRAPFAGVRQKVAQIGEAWPDKKIINELAKKLGLGEYFWDDVNDALDLILKPVGLTFDEFRNIGTLQAPKEYRQYEKEGFKTPSGKVELYSSRLEQWGHEPLPVYHELPETPYSAPELSKEYPLIFTSYHQAPFRHSNNRQIASLRNLEPEPRVEIHPETAQRLAIDNGDMVYIETKRGRIKQRAVLTEGIDPRVVGVSYAWWFPEQDAKSLHGWRESNINVLTASEPPYNPQIGSTNLRGLLCRVYKVNE
jgi:anaerobic selenocysteine-containing dehydrogenase